MTNTRLRTELEELEERARRRDLLAGDDEVYAFYDQRVPESAVSAKAFRCVVEEQRHVTPDLLTMTREDLLRTDTDADQPDTWQTGDLALPLSYRFESGAADDGVTVHVPVEVLARLGGDGFAWQVPALRRGAGDGADQIVAQGPAAQLRARTRHRAGGAARPESGRRLATGRATA